MMPLAQGNCLCSILVLIPACAQLVLICRGSLDAQAYILPNMSKLDAALICGFPPPADTSFPINRREGQVTGRWTRC